MATATNPAPSSSSAHHSPRSPNSRWASAGHGGSSSWAQTVRDCDSEYVISSSSSAAAAAAAVNGVLSPHSSSSSGGVVAEASANSSSSPASSDSSPFEAASTLAAVAGSVTCPSMESGGAACAVETPAESTEHVGGSSGINATKKPAWNKPSNVATAEISAVMGAVSWPALSESTRSSPKKSSSSDSLKALSDGPVSLSQGAGVGFSSTHKQDTSSNTNPILAPHYAGLARQRSMKIDGGGMSNSDGSANDNFSQSLAAEGAVVELVSNNLGKSSGSAGESFAKDNMNREAGHSGGSHGGNVLQQQRSSFRRGSGGPHPRGDVSHHHGRGGRRDRERGNQDWDTPHRSFGSREGNMPQQRAASRPFIRSPVPSTHYITPPPLAVRPFATPMVYTEVPSPVYYVPGPHPDPLRMPMVPMPPVIFPVSDPHLPNKIVNQIDYYFSNENLVKDTFLRQNMDVEGWVSIHLIAGFKKVMQLTDNIQLILEAVRASNVVEVQENMHQWGLPWIVDQKLSTSQLQTLATDDNSTAPLLRINSSAVRQSSATPLQFLSRSLPSKGKVPFAVFSNGFSKMYTALQKIHKDKDAEPTEFEESVAQALFDLESTNQEIKSDLKDLYINSAMQIDVSGNKKAVVIHVPYRLRKAFRKIHPRLVRELEKKFSGKEVVLIATRRILRPPKKGSAVQRPRTRTLTAVHEAMLEDIVYPAEIVGKRVRYRLDGSKIMKVLLDPKAKNDTETKLETFAGVYRKLSGRDVVFEFPNTEA
ncbi:unnamed protein product [Fraxinus pennsylvanica]|uniref:HTH La-type RNA-binding domain-containing protein n=1 Tax=Fraxinus pennsylvanica TaxID=56036 RepID=A0AAD2A0K7_9LAMI|nr:unnamed protein product [Fraxinus pennsylvanica]